MEIFFFIDGREFASISVELSRHSHVSLLRSQVPKSSMSGRLRRPMVTCLS